jgi:hypothetical protein
MVSDKKIFMGISHRVLCRLPTKMATKLKIEKGGMKFKKNLLL